jgi:hypothetical protein
MSADPFPSPEAIEAARASLPDSHLSRPEMRYALNAAVKAQPVVALPPCPTCKGWGHVPDDTGRPGTFIGKDDPPCPSCKGSGVDRLIPESEIREWAATMSTAPWTAEARGDGIPEGYLVAMRDLARWLDEREARQ